MIYSCEIMRAFRWRCRCSFKWEQEVYYERKWYEIYILH